MDKYLKILFGIIVLSLLIFSPGLFNFFSTDDWFHLRVSQVSSFNEFINFFSFEQTPQSTPFYRPISTQVFFFSFQSLFGINPLPIQAAIFALFALNLYLIYKLALSLLNDKTPALVAVFIYGISATNFSRLYFPSMIQEVLMLTFVLLSFLSYIKPGKHIFSLIFFILAVLSKETALALPVILLGYEVIKHRKVNILKTAPYFLLIIPFVLVRYLNLNEGVTSSYLFDFSPRKVINTLMWYFLWAQGTPELFVDYVSSGFQIIPRFFTDFPVWSKIIIGFTMAVTLSLGVLVIQNIKKLNSTFLLGAFMFVAGLGPLIFLPHHKFVSQLTLSMVGFSLIVASLYNKKLLFWLFLGIFTSYNLFTNIVMYQTHYTVSRGEISERVFNYFAKNYPTPPENSYFLFKNDTPAYVEEWGSSKQIYQVTAGSELFRTLYRDRNYNIYFEDLDLDKLPQDKTKIEISTEMFLK